MKRVLLLAILTLSVPAILHADSKNKKAAEPAAAPADDKEIHWITSFDELQQKMKEHPKKVYVDVYTGWCGWCKKMDASTFNNPSLIKYMNANFYAVKFDAERQDPINFQGEQFKFEPQYRANTLVVRWLKGADKISYPTAVFMTENFQNPMPVPGYMTVAQIEPILSYFGDNAYKHVSWDAYLKAFKTHWDNGQPADNTPPPNHNKSQTSPGN